jgi:hypothetical protein
MPQLAATSVPAMTLADYTHRVWGKKDGLAAETFLIDHV